MKKILSLTCLSLLMSIGAFAQEGENPWASKKAEENPWGPEVAYADSMASVIPFDTVAYSDEQLEQLGFRDAVENYKSEGSFAAGCTSGSCGVVAPFTVAVPVGMSVTLPKYLAYQPGINPQYTDNTAYQLGYRTGMRRIRAKKVWGGFAVGFGVTMAGALVLFSNL